MEAKAAGSGEASPDNKAAAKNRNEKFIRLITVIAYFCTVSGAAVMLSLYYIFLWDPDPRSNHAAFQETAYTPSLRSQLPSLSTSESPLLRHLIGDHTVTAPINLTSELLTGVASNGTWKDVNQFSAGRQLTSQ